MRRQVAIVVKEELCQLVKALLLVTIAICFFTALAFLTQRCVGSIYVLINNLFNPAAQIGYPVEVNSAVFVELDPVQADAELACDLVESVVHCCLVVEWKSYVRLYTAILVRKLLRLIAV